MSSEQLAKDDFDRALSRAFWRKVLTRLKGENNELLPFDEVREQLIIQGQHYAGFHQVPVDKIVGSMGRYKDFDRAFLPTQQRTKDRWMSIDKAHYEEIPLPPVDLYKIGEIYFVKDGNHRVSVARERGQIYVDAFVTEIRIPVVLTPDIRVDDLKLKREHSAFLLHTELNKLRPGAQVELTLPGLYPRLLEHIDVHRWYMGEQRQAEAPYAEAVASWYDQVYMPLAAEIRAHGLLDSFRGHSEADLYLWIMEYQGMLRQAYRAETGVEATGVEATGAEAKGVEAKGAGATGSDEAARAEALKQFVVDYPQPAVRQLVAMLNRAAWLDELILSQERAAFLEATRLLEVRPQARVAVSLPGQYDKLREHIAAHRWYLGEQRQAETPYAEAVASWYDGVYMPLVEIVREQGILREFPGRTETDLYLWIIQHQWHLREAYGDEVDMQQAAAQFAQDYSQRPVKRVVKALKKAARKKGPGRRD